MACVFAVRVQYWFNIMCVAVQVGAELVIGQGAEIYLWVLVRSPGAAVSRSCPGSRSKSKNHDNGAKASSPIDIVTVAGLVTVPKV